MVTLHRNTGRAKTLAEGSLPELIKMLLSDVAKILVLSDIDRSVLSQIFELELKIATQQKLQTTKVEVLGAAQRDCMEIICAWRRNKAYLDADAEPVALQFEGCPPSFRALCSDVGATSSAEQLRDLLIGFNAVCVDSNGRLRPVTPTFVVSETGGGNRAVAVDTALRQLIGFASTVACNVATTSPKRFERACTVTVAEELVPIFERLVKDRGQLLVDSLDEWLERRRNDVSPSNRYLEVGVGVYAIRE